MGRLSNFTHNPSRAHWITLERVFRYLNGTLDYKLTFSGFPDVIERNSDANWVIGSDSVKSTSRFVFLLDGTAMSWRACEQIIISRSIMEAELIALDTTCLEAEWLKNLVSELPISS